MAKKQDSQKIVLERIYNIPLRKEFLKVAKYKRAKKAVRAVKEFLVHHMKSEDVKLGKYLNLKIWERGIKNPPHHVKVKVTKTEEGTVMAELVDLPAQKVDKKKEKKQAKVEKATSDDKKSLKKKDEVIDVENAPETLVDKKPAEKKQAKDTSKPVKKASVKQTPKTE